MLGLSAILVVAAAGTISIGQAVAIEGLQGLGETRYHVAESDASDDDARFLEPRSRWFEHWTQQSDLPWVLRTETLDGHNHFSAPAGSFRRGTRWLFADELDSSGQ